MRPNSLIITTLGTLFLVAMGNIAHAAYPAVKITGVTATPLDGPAHHGLLVTTEGIANPNLTYYEVQVKPDTPLPAPPWAVYSTTIKPFDATTITVPYRNSTLGLDATTKYCVRVRAIYAAATTAWTQSCGFQLQVGSVAAGDTDADGLSDGEEYALGIDPNNPDTDADGMADGVELANITNPNKPLYGTIQIDTPTIDFGTGNPLGAFPNQHRVLVLTNIGDQPATIEAVEISAPVFRIGQFPEHLSHIPPHNVARIPISFLPTQRGPVQGTATVEVAFQSDLKPIALTGTGVQIPDCVVGPQAIDFGTVAATDQATATQEITIANQSPVGDVAPNTTMPFGFTIHSGNVSIAPGLRGLRLAAGKALTIPILFQHAAPGNYDTAIRILSFYCGEQVIAVHATAN